MHISSAFVLENSARRRINSIPWTTQGGVDQQTSLKNAQTRYSSPNGLWSEWPYNTYCSANIVVVELHRVKGGLLLHDQYCTHQ